MAIDTSSNKFSPVALAAPLTAPMSDEHRQRLFDAVGAPPDNIAQPLESWRQKRTEIGSDRRLSGAGKAEMLRQLRDITQQQFNASYAEYEKAELRKSDQSIRAPQRRANSADGHE